METLKVSNAVFLMVTYLIPIQNTFTTSQKNRLLPKVKVKDGSETHYSFVAVVITVVKKEFT